MEVRIMRRCLPFVALAFLVVAAPLSADGISGKYVEARTCDIWTGPCFANAEMNLTGKHAVVGWKVEKGALDNVCLDGLCVVAVLAANDTLGLDQTGPARTVLIVDENANAAQREALVRLAKNQNRKLVGDVVAIETAKIDLQVNDCKEGGCAVLQAGKARVETRCLSRQHDKVCGNESAFYPPLAGGVKAIPAMAVEHRFSGKEFNETWSEAERRGAYVGSFEVR
jgi:hypothetical protein